MIISFMVREREKCRWGFSRKFKKFVFLHFYEIYPLGFYILYNLFIIFIVKYFLPNRFDTKGLKTINSGSSITLLSWPYLGINFESFYAAICSFW